MDKLLLVFVLLLSSYTVTAKDIIRGEATKTEDRERLLQLIKLSKQYWESNPPLAVTYGKEAAQLARKLNKEAELGQALNNVSVAYYWLGDYAKSAEYAFGSLRARESAKDSAGIASSYNTIGNIYSSQKKLQKALLYFSKAYDIAKRTNYAKVAGSALNNQGAIYEELKEYDKALQFYRESNEISEQTGNKEHVAVGLLNIGFIYNLKGNHKKAMQHLQEALRISKEVKSENNKMFVYRGISEVYLDQKQYHNALAAADQSLKIARALRSAKGIYEAAKLLEEIHLAKNDYKQAHEFLAMSVTYKDSLHRWEKADQLSEMQMKMDMQKQEDENKILKAEAQLQEKRLEQKTLIQYAIGLHLLIMTVLALFFYISRQRVNTVNKQLLESNYLLIQKNQEIERQQKELAHFNNLKASGNKHAI